MYGVQRKLTAGTILLHNYYLIQYNQAVNIGINHRLPIAPWIQRGYQQKYDMYANPPPPTSNPKKMLNLHTGHWGAGRVPGIENEER